MNKTVAHILEIICSGLVGAVLTIGYQHFIAPSQAFTVVYNGEETIVTKTAYTELVEQNNELKQELSLAKEQLNEFQAQLEQQNLVEEIDKIIQDATNYWNNSDYVQALTILKNSKSKSADISFLYKQYSNEYCISLLEQSDLFISERKYDEAIEILEQGKALVFDNQAISNKIQDINNKLPIKLSKLKISTSRYFDLNQDKPSKDTVGNKYTSGNVFITYAEGESGYGYSTFYLGEKYTSLSGTIAVSDESENRDDVQLEGWIEIYSKNGEDYTQLWASPMLSRMTSPIKIPEISISSSEWLEIRYYNNGEYWNMMAGYHSLRVIISDVMVFND